MNDDFSPIEYSWNWNASHGRPSIRYSVELVGGDAGSSKDPYNQQATLDFYYQLRRDSPTFNWDLFDILHKALHDPDAAPVITPTDRASPSSLFLAFELSSQINTKAYFLPVRAAQRGIPPMTVLTDAVQTMQENGYSLGGIETLLHYTRTTTQGTQLHILAAAIDLVASSDSRFKIYMRSPCTSFAAVCESLTLGSALPPLTATARTNLKDLWRLSLGLAPDFSEDQDLQSRRHETAGVLYYFDLELQGERIKPKLYIPLKHYASSDAAAAQGLGAYLESRGQGEWFSNYIGALRKSCAHRSLDADRGAQTYLGVSIQKDGSLALCSYINGEAYHPIRRGL